MCGVNRGSGTKHLELGGNKNKNLETEDLRSDAYRAKY